MLFDGKLVELGMYKKIADEFVGPDLHHAIITLRRLQTVMNNRYAWLEACQRREIRPDDGLTTITSIFDEIALYSTVLGTKAAAGRIHHPVPRPGGPRPRRRHAGHRRDPAAIGGHHPEKPAGPVRLPRRVPLHL